jgi:hypothetical protein
VTIAAQLDGIFGAARTGGYQGYKWSSAAARTSEKDIRTWGQLGLNGTWANKPINTAGPFTSCTRTTVADRSYPLTRSIFIQLNRPPGTALNPLTKEFLRFILSRQGQTAVQVQGEYIPLTRDELDRQIGALD